ncbi:uncharacterized protein ACA1_115210 [Acanthamoeba castellanii str. Neff]|uniref:Uncharacterized protein n=1 Tax=Acanthamoeba castellanii (strain ATCC 30010 / Neff) TaxID=1257118 RepID=L8H6Q0_ACACF|nr:uncharacterized protein ACA1_115210 [Acanthamoeba castellanii str. Neff]ELR20111.1 hypothetical protein ACA1_115210 [Acanthamoeba castellanii str. Neff]
MFPVQNYEDMEGDDHHGLRVDERPGRKGATRGWMDDREEHDFGSTTDRFFRREKRGGESDDNAALRRARAEKEDLRTGLFGRGKAARQQDEAHSRTMVTDRLKTSGGGRREEHASEDVCRSLQRADKIACQYFVRTFGDDIMSRLDEPVEEICEELDYAKTAPSRLQNQSDATKRDNIRGGEDARRARGGDPTRDRAPTADLDEGARGLTVSRARTPGGGSAGLNKGGRSMPVVSSAQQKEVGRSSVDPHDEGHPAASSGRAGLKGVGVNRQGE